MGVRLQKAPTGERALYATAVQGQGAQVLSEARVRAGTGEVPTGTLRQLAVFLRTGGAQPGVEPLRPRDILNARATPAQDVPGPDAIPAAPAAWRSRAWIPAAAGGALLAGGGVFYGMARSSAARLREGDATLQTSKDVDALAARARRSQTTGFVLMGAGAAALAGAGALYWMGDGAPPVAVGVVPQDRGALAQVGGSF